MSDQTLTTPPVAVTPLLQARWSPRAFNADAQIRPNELTSMLEAARWSPSANNGQPWRFIIAERGTPRFNNLLQVLAPGNLTWAQHASALLVALAVTADAAGNPQRWATYDLGQAVAHLTLQAHALGYHAHQIGGFDAAGLRTAFDLTDDLQPVTMIALGAVAAPEMLPEGYRQRETAPRVRLPLAEIVLQPS